jgi:tetratricopeptide (TPR) repeat protein
MVRAVFALSFLLLVGCEDGSRADSRTLDVDDPEFRQGQTFHKQGEVRKALECFLKVIDNRKGAAESHLEAGRMYLELQDPLPAIYHFNQYIRMKPTSEQSNIVRQMVKTAEKQFMQQLPGRPMEPDALGGADLNARLRSPAAREREAQARTRRLQPHAERPRASAQDHRRKAGREARDQRRRHAAALPPVHDRERRQPLEHRPQELRRRRSRAHLGHLQRQPRQDDLGEQPAEDRDDHPPAGISHAPDPHPGGRFP